MKLHLDLDGIDFQLGIYKYQPSTMEKWGNEWTWVELSAVSKDWLNFHLKSEILLSCEVETLRDKLKYLLNDNLKQTEYISFIEPDLEFMLAPKQPLSGRLSQYSGTYAELTINTWSDGLTGNRIILLLDDDDIQMLLSYLELITGITDENDNYIKDLKAKRHIL